MEMQVCILCMNELHRGGAELLLQARLYNSSNSIGYPPGGGFALALRLVMKVGLCVGWPGCGTGDCPVLAAARPSVTVTW